MGEAERERGIAECPNGHHWEVVWWVAQDPSGWMERVVEPPDCRECGSEWDAIDPPAPPPAEST